MFTWPAFWYNWLRISVHPALCVRVRVCGARDSLLLQCELDVRPAPAIPLLRHLLVCARGGSGRDGGGQIWLTAPVGCLSQIMKNLEAVHFMLNEMVSRQIRDRDLGNAGAQCQWSWGGGIYMAAEQDG